VVNKGTLNSVRNIFQGSELGLNLIAHLQKKKRNKGTLGQDKTWALYRVTKIAQQAPVWQLPNPEFTRKSKNIH
jgi:hypothetical protein